MKLVLLVAVLVFVSAGVFALQLTENGNPRAVIVCTADATEPERNAAAELAKYIEQISGAQTETVPEPVQDKVNIYVGQTEATKKLLPGFDWSSLRHDGIVIKAGRNSLVLAGDRPRGTLYAVYEFLERYLGVRYLTPDAEIVPEEKSIRISDKTEHIFTPAMFSREAYYAPNINHPDFAVKLKLNGSYNNIAPEWGGHCELIGFAHTFGSMLLPQGVYFDEHPEWYALRGGKRVPTQPCLSNPEVLDKLAENVLKELDKRENPMMISVTQNDNDQPCQCEKCQAMVKEFGAESGMLINALNYISEKIKDKYPDVLLETFAYQYTVPAPTNIKPADNVVVRLCDIENNFGEPIREKSSHGPYRVIDNCRIFGYADQQTVNRDYLRSLETWGKIAKNLFIWNYTVNFNNYYIIHPNFHVLKPDVETFLRNHAVAIFEQGDAANTAVAFNVVKQYLLAHLIWDSSIDDDAVIREFMQNYYGPAWKELYELITFCEGLIRDKSIFLSTYMNDVSWMSPREMIHCFELFTKALSTVSGDKIYRDRVYNELIIFQTGWYLADEETRREVADSGWLQITDPKVFSDTLYKHVFATGNARFSEGTPMELTEFAPAVTIKPSGKVPPECEGLSAEEWLEIPADQFGLSVKEGWSRLIKDETAVTGHAAVLNTNSVQWAVNCKLTAQFREKVKQGYTKVHVFGTFRTNGKQAEADDVVALHALLWDSGYHMDKVMLGKELSDQWKTIDLGTYGLWNASGLAFYLYTTPDSRLGDGIYTDRVYMIFEK